MEPNYIFDEELKEDYEYILKNVPVLYKYIDLEGGEKLLKNSTLLIKNPSIFNDPYDCFTGLIKFDNMPDSYFKDLVNKYYGHLARQERRKYIQSLNKSEKHKLVKVFENNFLPQEKESKGVTCFSENYENMLMWSQYADSHKGVCVGFDLPKLYFSLKSLNFNETTMLKVKYVERFESFNFFADGKRAVINWLRIKSKDWIYEKEIRFSFAPILFDETKQILAEFSKDVITKIYLGSKIDEENQKKILNVCKENYPNAEIYKMRLDISNFRMIPEVMIID